MSSTRYGVQVHAPNVGTSSFAPFPCRDEGVERTQAQPRRAHKRRYDEGPNAHEGPSTSSNQWAYPSTAHGPPQPLQLGRVPEYSGGMSHTSASASAGGYQGQEPASFGPVRGAPASRAGVANLGMASSQRSFEYEDGGEREWDRSAAPGPGESQPHAAPRHKMRKARHYETQPAFDSTPSQSSSSSMAMNPNPIQATARFRARSYSHSTSPAPSYTEFHVDDLVTRGYEADNSGRRGRQTRYPTQPESPLSDSPEQLGPQPSTFHEQERSARRTRAPANGSGGQQAPNPASTYRLVTLLMEDRRGGPPLLAELRVIVQMRGGLYVADAYEISESLQRGPQRIDGPAKVSVYRGEMKQTFLRVPAVHIPGTPVDSTKGIHIMLASENASRFTASLVIEDDPSGRIPHACTRPCCIMGPPPSPLPPLEARRSSGKRERRSGRSRIERPPPLISRRSDTPASPAIIDTRTLSLPQSQSSREESPLDEHSNFAEPVLRQNSASQRSPSVSSVHTGYENSLFSPARTSVPPSQQMDRQTSASSASYSENEAPPAPPKKLVTPAPVPASAAAEHSPVRSPWAVAGAAATPPTPPRASFGSTATTTAFSSSSSGSAFGASAFAKYGQGSGFGFLSGPVPPPPKRAPGGEPPRTKEPTEEEKRTMKAVVGYVKGQLQRDPNYKVYQALRRQNPQPSARELLEMYNWVEAQVRAYVGEVTPDHLEGAPDVTITKTHVMDAISFFPDRQADDLEDLLQLNDLYGPDGPRSGDAGVIAALDTPVDNRVSVPLTMEHYYTALRVAHQRWSDANPTESNSHSES